MFPEQQIGSKLSGRQQTVVLEAIDWVNVPLDVYGREPYNSPQAVG